MKADSAEPAEPAARTRQRALRDICQALDMAPGEDRIEALLNYLALLERWNATYNLSAIRDPQAMLTQHLADCLAVVPALERELAQQPSAISTASPRILDVGSGGGLPGVVLAILRPDWRVTCLDAVAKKAAFIRQAAGALGLANLEAVHARVESFQAPVFDVITARAFSSLAELVALGRHLLAPHGLWMAMKGREPHDEIAALPGDIEMFHVEPLTVPGLDAQRCLVWMRLRRDTGTPETAPAAPLRS